MKTGFRRFGLPIALRVGQAITLAAGLWLFHLAIVYRPYLFCGNLMCSFTPENRLATPPMPDNGDTVDFVAPLCFFQIALIPWVTLMAILLLWTDVTRQTVLRLFTIGIAGVVLLQAIASAFLEIPAMQDGSDWVFRPLIKLGLVIAIAVVISRRLWTKVPDGLIVPKFASLIIALLAMQSLWIGADSIIGSGFDGGFWAFLAGLLLSLVGIVRMATIAPDPQRVPFAFPS